MKPTYFDLTVRDLPKAKAFFGAVLGWEFQEFAPGYFQIKAGPDDEPGINGGTILERRTAIPGIGWFSACAEPGGLIFGIIESDPTAPAQP